MDEPRTSGNSVLTTLFVLMLGFGLLSSLLGVRAALEGFSTVAIGAIGSAYYLGFLAGALVVPKMVGAVGHIRVYSALAAVNATAALVFPFVVTPAAWFAIRLVVGLCLSGMYLVAESWLNAVSTNRTRGRLLSKYLLVVNIGFGVGQYLLAAAGPDGVLPFAIASAFCSLSIVPLTLTRTAAPSHSFTDIAIPIRVVTRAAPLAPVTSIASGIGVGVAMGLGPVYGVATGMDVHRVALFMGLAMIGGVTLQWPIGAWSDHAPRRHVILATAMLSGVVALAGLAFTPGTWPVFAVFAGFAALSFPLYSLAISHLSDAIDPGMLVPAGAVLIMAYGAGSVTGPLAASLAMDRVGPSGFWVVLAASTLLLSPYAVYRLARRPALGHLRRHVPLPPEAVPTLVLDEAEVSPDAV